MKLSRASKYGLMGVLDLAAQPEGTVRHAGEIAGGGVLRSYRARSRGYALARPADSISVRVVVEAIEGPHLFRRCVFWSDACSDARPCVVHDLWQQVRPEMERVMEQTSITALARAGKGW